MVAWRYQILLLEEKFRISARPCNILFFCKFTWGLRDNSVEKELWPELFLKVYTLEPKEEKLPA